MLNTRKVERYRNIIFNKNINYSRQAILNNIRKSETEDEKKKKETHFITLPFDIYSSDNKKNEPEV